MTSDDILIGELFRTAGELNDAARVINEHYEVLEDAFNAAGVGCNAFVTASDWSADDPTTASVDFGYARVKNHAWCFVVRRGEVAVRIIEASRVDRVRCAELLPGLITALLILTRARRDEAREAESFLAALVAALPRTWKGSNMPRTVSSVIDAIIAIAPDLELALKPCRDSCGYTAPEQMHLRWIELAEILEAEADDHPKKAEIVAIVQGTV